MLNDNYNMHKPEEVRELYRVAPPILMAILAAINEHNTMCSKIGYEISPNNHYDRKSYKSEYIKEKIEKKKAVRSKILSACRSIGYTYKTEVDGRIHSLVPRRDSKRVGGKIFYINAKALFIIEEANAVSKLESLLVSNIIEGTND